MLLIMESRIARVGRRGNVLFERYCQDVVSELLSSEGLSRRGCQGDVVDEILSRRCY